MDTIKGHDLTEVFQDINKYGESKMNSLHIINNYGGVTEAKKYFKEHHDLKLIQENKWCIITPYTK